MDSGTASEERSEDIAKLDLMGLACLHRLHLGDEAMLAQIHNDWSGRLVLNRAGGPRDRIGRDVAAGRADLESYGQMILVNPDVVEPIKAGAS